MNWGDWFGNAARDNEGAVEEEEPDILGRNSDLPGTTTTTITGTNSVSINNDPEESALPPRRQQLSAFKSDDDKDRADAGFHDQGGKYNSRREKKLLKQEEDADVSLRDVITDWSSNTSIHGIQWIANHDSNAVWYRLLWTVMSLIGVGGMIWQVAFLVRQYKEHQVIQDVQTFHPDVIEMPQVTVCNLNKYLRSKQEELNITEPRNDDEFRALTLDLDEFIFETRFNLEEVDDPSTVWKESLNSLGRCWDFRTDKGVRLPGVDGGLDFEVKLHQKEYSDSTMYAGVVLFVTEPGTKVNRQMYPIIIKPGSGVTVGIEKTVFKRETRQPWSSCSGSSPLDTLIECREKCLLESVVDNCGGCKILGDDTERAKELPYCNSKDLDWCESTALKGQGSVNPVRPCNAQCLPSCHDHVYDVTSQEVSQSLVSMERVASQLNITREELATEWSQIHVGFKSISYTLREERPSIHYVELLADIGGSMGLFLGISVLSFFELFFDLLSIRLVPRFFGVRHLYGIGGKNALKHKDH